VLWAVLALSVVVAAVAQPRIEAHYLQRAGAADTATMRLATEVLRGALERTEALPALIAERPDPRAASARSGQCGAGAVHQRAAAPERVVARRVGHLRDGPEGRTVATSNYRADWSFLGRSFAYRPYFTDAISEGLGRFHALGTTSNQRGYFFAAPVIDQTELLGVVAVKITLDRFEETWANSDSTILVTDTSNVVFLSDRADWHFRTSARCPSPPSNHRADAAIPAFSTVPLDARRTGRCRGDGPADRDRPRW
jgi:two-component system C4-dicarboxylate transport sensor histidine kinase DctB